MLGAAFIRTPALETKTAVTENATGISVNSRASTYEHDRTEKICVLDRGRADRCWAAFRTQDALNRSTIRCTASEILLEDALTDSRYSFSFSGIPSSFRAAMFAATRRSP